MSVHRVEDITEALLNTKVSPSTISELNKKVYQHIVEPADRRASTPTCIWTASCSSAAGREGEVRNVSFLVASGVGEDGFRKVLGIAEGHKEDKVGVDCLCQASEGSGLNRCAADHLRCVHGASGVGCRVLSRNAVATLYGAFLPQYLHGGAKQATASSC